MLLIIEFELTFQTLRFWSCFELFIIAIIVTPLELISLSHHTSINTDVVADIIKSFSFLIVFTIFVLNEDVRHLVFRK